MNLESLSLPTLRLAAIPIESESLPVESYRRRVTFAQDASTLCRVSNPLGQDEATPELVESTKLDQRLPEVVSQQRSEYENDGGYSMYDMLPPLFYQDVRRAREHGYVLPAFFFVYFAAICVGIYFIYKKSNESR